MAAYKLRGNTFCVIYRYQLENGKKKQQWESYDTEAEAMQRTEYINFLQKCKKHDEVVQAVLEYKKERNILTDEVAESLAEPGNNMNKTVEEFLNLWLPFYARKKRFSPNTFDSYRTNIDTHILPYFEERLMSSITAEDIDKFIDFLSKKPCSGSKSYNKESHEIPRLSSSVIKKCYTVFTASFQTAKAWGYMEEIPYSSAPSEKSQKRNFWNANQVWNFLNGCREDPVLHLAVHLAFTCSLRIGETLGVDIKNIKLVNKSFFVSQEVQRVSDKALNELPPNEIIRIFPKARANSKSSVILKGPKTENSKRKQYMPTPLAQAVLERLEQIKRDKAYHGDEYHDYGLLICQPNGKPYEPNTMQKKFNKMQRLLEIEAEERVEFQGLRKSGQMHKIRISNYNYTLVASNGGHTEAVLKEHYDEALDSEKRGLMELVEKHFYGSPMPQFADSDKTQTQMLFDMLENDPALREQLINQLGNGNNTGRNAINPWA